MNNYRNEIINWKGEILNLEGIDELVTDQFGKYIKESGKPERRNTHDD
ncbi:MAG: hypothetical protein ACXAC7_19125 [Candidatus Hodarchaeales archaeon]